MEATDQIDQATQLSEVIDRKMGQKKAEEQLIKENKALFEAGKAGVASRVEDQPESFQRQYQEGRERLKKEEAEAKERGSYFQTVEQKENFEGGKKILQEHEERFNPSSQESIREKQESLVRQKLSHIRSRLKLFRQVAEGQPS